MFSIGKTLIRSAAALGIAAAIGLTSTPAAPVQAQTAQCTPNYVVQPGDNLFRIGLRFNTSYLVLQRLNNIYNINVVYVGQVICLPGSTVPGATPIVVVPPPATPIVVVPPTIVPTIIPTVVAPATGIVLPPVNVFPTITFNTRTATIGDSLTITGSNFPTNETVDVFINTFSTTYNANYLGTPIATGVSDGFGRVNLTVAIPAVVGTETLRGQGFSFLVRGRVTNYYGFNFVYNSRPN